MPNNLFLGFMVAVILSVGTFLVENFFPSIFGFSATMRVLVVGLCFVYTLILAFNARRREGRLILTAVASVGAVCSMFLPFGLLELVVFNGSIVIIAQWCLVSRTPLIGLIDAFILVGAGGTAIVVSGSTNSLTTGVWVGLLCLCLAKIIPVEKWLFEGEVHSPKQVGHDFDSAHRNAEKAIQTISTMM